MADPAVDGKRTDGATQDLHRPGAPGDTRPDAPLRVIPVTASVDEWDAYVERTPGGTFCHLSGWGSLLGEVMGARPLYRAATRPDGEWAGVLPLFEVRSRLFGHFLVSVPYLNYGGPLGAEEARRLLVREATEEARSRGADLLELRSRAELPDLPDGVVRTDRKITVLLDLPADPDTLFDDVFRSKLRSQIRRPMKEGMEARFGPEEVESFLPVFQRTMRDLGTPTLPAELFRRLPETFGDRVHFGAVYLEGRPVAAGCGFSMGGEMEMTWAGALREHQRQAPNMLLYWAFMERAIEQGLKVFNFGRCTPGGGTHRFKKQWESRDEPLPWCQWSPSGVDATPSPESGRYDLAIRLWQRLPLGVANRAGPFLSRKIP